jgi:hypothetical protein
LPKSVTSGGPTEMDETQTKTWIKDMHDHFRATGSYRISDVQRVLGDQAKHVELRGCTEMRLAAWLVRDS